MLIQESPDSRKRTTIPSNMHIRVIRALCIRRLVEFTRKTIKYSCMISIY
jgi:hypothetical protein